MANDRRYHATQDDPRLLIAAAAGMLRADEVWTKDGWRKAPAQCPIYMALLANSGLSAGYSIALADAWNKAYRARCAEYEAEALT